MPFASVNGTELYYERHGEGRSIVFCHGDGRDHRAASNPGGYRVELPASSRSRHPLFLSRPEDEFRLSDPSEFGIIPRDTGSKRADRQKVLLDVKEVA